MRILHVETGRHFYGGAQQVVYLIEGLGRQDVDNLLVCPPESDISRRARDAVSVIPVPCAGDLDAAFAWRLKRVLSREKPDLVHCHSRRGADSWGGVAAALAGIPAVLSRRVDHTEPALLAALRYRPYCKVIAISASVAGALRKSGLADERLTIIRSAVDAAPFSDPPSRDLLKEQFGVAGGDFAIAAIGQLIPRKGHRYLLDAMAAVARHAPRARLVVFGQGRLQADLEAHAGRLNLGRTVQFAGFRHDLDRYLAAFDLVVHPALREGLGVAMLKAAAAGVPVIAFDVAGAREAVSDRRTGLLVKPGDADALAEAILMLLGDDALRRSCGEAARQRARSEFSLQTMVTAHMQLYESILAGGKHAG
jgi:glycosyltransferase involved in cell wall biosynthesis